MSHASEAETATSETTAVFMCPDIDGPMTTWELHLRPMILKPGPKIDEVDLGQRIGTNFSMLIQDGKSAHPDDPDYASIYSIVFEEHPGAELIGHVRLDGLMVVHNETLEGKWGRKNYMLIAVAPSIIVPATRPPDKAQDLDPKELPVAAPGSGR